jgi:cytidine deaminase
MNTFKITSTITELDSENELSQEEKKLLSLARETAKSAYAPYSNFFVGAALLLENGEIIIGNNQENVAFPSGICAERVAFFSAAARFPGVAAKTVAITARSNSLNIEKPVTPCGACRQVMAEYEELHKKDIRVILSGEKGKIYIVESVKTFLPLMFSGGGLRKG